MKKATRGRPRKDHTMAIFPIRLPSHLVNQIEKMAEKRYMSRSEYIRQVLIEHVEGGSRLKFVPKDVGGK